MKNYRHKIVIENYTKNKKLYKMYKNDIYDFVNEIIANFNFDVSIKITFINKCKNNRYEAFTTYIKGVFYINIVYDILKEIAQYGDLELAATLYHELAHVYDIYCSNHRMGYNLTLIRTNTYEKFVIKNGWRIWDEYTAYCATFNTFKEWNRSGYTILSLMKEYEQLEKQKELLEKEIKNKSNHICKIAIDYGEKIEQFLYDVSVFCAKYLSERLNDYEYSAKIANKREYKLIKRVTKGIIARLVEINSNTYGTTMDKKLFALGKYVEKQIYFRLSIEPIKRDGYFLYAYAFCRELDNQ